MANLYYYSEEQCFPQWELERCCDSVQGKLVPKLYFVSREASGKRMFGLELGAPVRRSDEKEYALYQKHKVTLRQNLSKTGWMQREESFDRTLMKNKNGTRRLVAIDIESFVPTFNQPEVTIQPTSGVELILGIPFVSPAEVKPQYSHVSYEYRLRSKYEDGVWRKRERVTIKYQKKLKCQSLSRQTSSRLQKSIRPKQKQKVLQQECWEEATRESPGTKDAQGCL